MKFKDLEKQRGLHRIQFLAAFGICIYWPLFFIFRYIAPEVEDDLYGRIAISMLSGLILVYSRMKDYRSSRLHLYANLAIALTVVHSAHLLVANSWSGTYQSAHTLLSIVLGTAAIEFVDYLWIAGLATVAPLGFCILYFPEDMLIVAQFSLTNAVLFFFVGITVRTNFKYRKDLLAYSEKNSKNSKLAALGQMAAGMAHEINTPLAVIKGKSDQIIMRTVSDGPIDREWLRSELGKIGNTVEKVARIVRGLKSFSRNSDQDPFVPIALKVWIQNTLELCKERMRHSQVELEIDPAPDVVVMGRESQLIQVLLNLLNNSIDALENSKLKKTKIQFEVQNDLLRILVFDTGPGIPSETISKITEPFFTTKPPGKGTGLGLSISRAIMENHSGSLIHVPSSPMTCFCIEIPCALQGENINRSAA